jgi:anti-sigma factor ChrR (cupin superfamily)
VCLRVSIRNPRKLMACFLPFRPWLSLGLRVFRFRTTRDQSTDPTHVLSCTCAPPQRLAPTLVTPR